MKVFLATALMLAILTPSVSQTSPTAESSIRIMSMQSTNEDGVTTRRNICTAFAIKTPKSMKWVSADHCVEGLTPDSDMRLGKYSATVISRHPEIDIAIIEGEPVQGFEIAKNAPMVGDKVIVIGHPWGWDIPARREGLISGLYDVTKNGRPHMISQLPAAHGDSGSPLFNSRMQVIGVMQVVFCGGLWTGFCPMSGGSTLADLQYAVSTIR